MASASVTASATKRRKANRQVIIERLMGAGLALPALILLAVITIAPLVTLLVLSFTDYELGATEMAGVGLGNYGKAISDPVFRRALRNTFLYVALVLPGAVVLGLFV